MKSSILDKRAYLSILIKNNNVYANLSYSDIDSDKVYILSDLTDLSILRRRLDDEVFSTNFWYEYFDALEKVFDWEFVERVSYGVFRIKDFENEGYGLSGIRVLIDDDQEFLRNITKSIQEFSREVAIRILDENTRRNTQTKLLDRMGYKDILLIDLDLTKFYMSRVQEISKKDQKDYIYNNFEINWGNKIGVVDAIRNSQFKALLALDVPEKEYINRWANFILNSSKGVLDKQLKDLLRSYTLVQLMSVFRDNKEKLEEIGLQFENTAVIFTGNVVDLLPNDVLITSFIDGFNILGSFDAYFDTDGLFYSFSRSFADGKDSGDAIVGKHDVFKKCSKVLVPELRSGKAKNKIVFKANITSNNGSVDRKYALNPEITTIPLEKQRKVKYMIEGSFEEGAYLDSKVKDNISFISSPEMTIYDNIVVDTRFRPIVYGPSCEENKNNIERWFHDY